MIKAFMNIEKPNSTILTVISILDAFSDATKMAIFIKNIKTIGHNLLQGKRLFVGDWKTQVSVMN